MDCLQRSAFHRLESFSPEKSLNHRFPANSFAESVRAHSAQPAAPAFTHFPKKTVRPTACCQTIG
jgi:hypothetical protein